jgi:hypothetical protein
MRRRGRGHEPEIYADQFTGNNRRQLHICRHGNRLRQFEGYHVYERQRHGAMTVLTPALQLVVHILTVTS